MTPPPAAPGSLARHGWAGAATLPLAGDASFRRYFRIREGARDAVLMDAPPEHEDVGPFLAVAAHLLAHGLAAPRIMAVDRDAGLVLLEDFGDARMAEVLAREPAREAEVYRRAIDLLGELQRRPPAAVPAYDMAAYLRETALFAEWYAPAAGIIVDAAGLAEAWREALAPVVAGPAVTVLRDYHAENIMLLADGRLGLLDFQDALVGHPAYDLVSLLQDARREVSPALEAAMLAYHGAVDAAAYALLGAQRNTKILGIFARLSERDGKPRYLALLPRVWRYLERDLAHPALAGVCAWFDANVPQAARAARWEQA